MQYINIYDFHIAYKLKSRKYTHNRSVLGPSAVLQYLFFIQNMFKRVTEETVITCCYASNQLLL